MFHVDLLCDRERIAYRGHRKPLLQKQLMVVYIPLEELFAAQVDGSWKPDEGHLG